MGIFSSKKKTYVDTSVTRVVADAQVPNSITDGMMQSLFTGRPLMEAIRETTADSPFRNFERMYRYAATGDYFYGLPNARVLTSSSGAAEVKAVIEGIVGATVTMDYAHFRPLNNVHMGWKAATETYGYDHETNELTVLSASIGYPVYLEDLIAVHSLASTAEAEKTALGVWGLSPKSGFTPERKAQTGSAIQALVTQQSYTVGSELTEGVELKYIWEVPLVRDPVTSAVVTPAVIHHGSVVISLAAYDMDLEYHQAKYHYSTGYGVEVGYWTYQPEDGGYPTLDAVFNLNYTTPGTYFPFAVFRREHTNRATPGMVGTPEYETTKKLLSYINIDYQEFADGINENPGIADVEQAVLMMAVPMATTVEVEIDYLMRFFSNLESTITFPTVSRLETLTNLSAGVEEGYAVEIADADFRIVVSFDKIEKRLRAGSIGAVGTFSNTTTTSTGISVQLPATNAIRMLRKQVSTGVYEEIRIHNPKIRYDIYAGKSTIGAGENETLLIPLDYDICRQMTMLQREELYHRALHFVANSRITEKVRWYETGVFKAILVVVAVVVTILTLGSTWQSIVAAAGVGATTTALVWAAIKAITVMILKGIVVSYAAQELAAALGPELAALMAVAAMAYGGYKAYQSGGLVAGSTAANLVNAGTALSQGAAASLQKLYAEFNAEKSAFDLLKEDKWAELEEANDLLKNAVSLDPFTFIGKKPLTVFGESPDHYYNRTVHSGNIGVKSFEIIQNFVAVSLRLPTIQSTAGDSFYV